MTETRCQECQTVIEDVDDGLQEIAYYSGPCPYCGFDPFPQPEDGD